MAGRINYYWRVLATGGCFAVFGLGGVVLWAFVFPMVRITSREKKRQERIRFVVHKTFQIFLRMMECVGVMRMKVDGAEKLKTSQGELVLSNHPTLLDVVVLISLMPMASCMAKQAMWKNYFLGGVVRSAGYISNSDAEHLLDDCAKDLHKGYSLIVFPEGTRTVPGEPLHFQRGAAYIALRSAKPIRPILIDCQPSTLTKREAWYQIPPRPFHLRVRILDSVDVGQWVQAGEPQTVAARKLTRALESFFSQELSKWIH